MVLVYLFSLRRIKGFIDIYGFVFLSFYKLLYLRVVLEDEGKREKKKLLLCAGSSYLDIV